MTFLLCLRDVMGASLGSEARRLNRRAGIFFSRILFLPPLIRKENHVVLLLARLIMILALPVALVLLRM